MILEQIVIDILKEEKERISRHVHWDGIYDDVAKRIVKAIKDKLLE